MIGQQRVVDLDVRLEEPEVLRMMGCGRSDRVRVPVRQMVARLLGVVQDSLQPRCAYVIHDVVRMTDTCLDLAGCPSFHGPIAGFLKPSHRVAVFVLTLGEELEKRGRYHMQNGRLLEGFTWDAIGSAAADIAVDAFTQHLFEAEASPDEAITPPFSPGYCGMPLEEQQTLFSILDTSPIGVKLWPTHIMEPIKSVSGLMGIGPHEAVVQHGVPCQWCNLETCRMRR